MPNTTNFGITYPANTDYVTNGASAMGTIATQVDSLLAAGQFMGGFRNKLINGDFLIWQRGTGTYTASQAFSADRWVQSFSGGTISTTRVGLSSTELGIFPYGRSMLQSTVAGGSTAGNYTILTQRVEFVGSLAGKTVTVSFWAKAAAGTPKVGISLDQVFGTGGSPSATVLGTGQSVTLSTTLTRYSKTFTVPSISGKTLGTAGDDYLALNLWFSAAADLNSRSGTVGVQSATFTILGVQLEAGAQPTDFEVRPYQVELALCQRYFEKSFMQSQAPVDNPTLKAGALHGQAVSTVSYLLFPGVRFSVTKRATPTLTFYNPGSGTAGQAANVNNLTTGFPITSAQGTMGNAISEHGFTISVNNSALTNTDIAIHWTASAEIS